MAHLNRFFAPHFVLYLVLFLMVSVATAQSAEAPPKREVRAVWITTAAGLDWPKSLDRSEQQSSLRNIVEDLHAAHFNTILFQVRPRGDAYYHSGYEPWAENLSGTLGKDPGWDPLAFLINEAHAAGIEVHAWFNVYKIRGPAPVGPSVPLHPARRFPAWVHDVDGEGWIDPGVPQVREYLVRVALDVVSHYDVDGIHFDFIRYPGRSFPDDETYFRYGHGMDRNEWRRSNIDRFVSAFYDSAMRLKPMLKVGSAPLGVFSVGSGENAWGAFHSYYQDSQGWLTKGKHDYLVPQLYWDLGATKDDPDFAELLHLWRVGSRERQMWAGIGVYKPEVKRELGAQIDSARAIGADGEAFFRYEFVSGGNVLGGRYSTLANIPPMTWKDSIPPLPPSELAVTELSPNTFHLEWLSAPAASDGDSARYYDIYRSTSKQIDTHDPSSLVAITSTNATFFVDTVHSSMAYKYYYTVSGLDKGNNESTPSNVASVTLKELSDLRGKLSEFTSLSASISRNGEGTTLVAYKVGSRGTVVLQVTKAGNDTTSGLVLVNKIQEPGTYVVGIAKDRLKRGTYDIQLAAGEIRIEQQIQVQR
jgi:uncharacterized lipoprotein YddW (UPF0748 family)